MEEFFSIKLFWYLFPKDRFWRDSIKSARLIQAYGHDMDLSITVGWFFCGKTKDTTTLFVIAKKKAHESRNE
jgi:hypothetical protein